MAGACAGALLKAPALTTMASGAISGAVQSLATVPRNWVIQKIKNSELDGAARITTLALAFIVIYAVHVPILVETSVLLFSQPMEWGTALGLTVVVEG